MRRIQKFAAINVIAALIGAGIPAMAAQDGHDGHNRGGGGAVQHQTADHRGNGEWRDSRNRDFRDNDRRDYDHRDNDRRDYDRRGDIRGYGYGYAAAPVYEAPPVYSGPAYDGGYYYDRSHNGRTAAIIGGSAAAGALIGAAAGHGQGAVIGAVVGGIAGAVASAAADHHHRY